MNFLDAAYEILKKTEQPLNYIEITNQALTEGLISTKGQTPEATMGSRLYTDTKQPNSRFRRVERNVFALTESPSFDIVQRVDSINRKTRLKLKNRLMNMHPKQFEILIGQLLERIGFDEDTIQITSYGKDGGVDVRGIMNAGGVTKINAAVQAKRWTKNIQAPTVQALRGALTVHEQGIIITTSGFSKGALIEAKAEGKAKISLIDGKKLIDLLIKHRIGVIAEKHIIFSLDDAEIFGDGNYAENDIKDLYKKNTVHVKYPIQIEAKAHGDVYKATLLNSDGKILFEGKEYRSPSGAGQAAAKWKSCNGWSFWRFKNPETGNWEAIESLRKQK